MAVREQKQHRSNFSILFRIYLLNYVFILPVCWPVANEVIALDGTSHKRRKFI